MKDDPVRPRATDGEGVADHGPLRLAVEAKDFSEIVNQAGEDKPARVAIAPYLLGGLEQVIELREIGVRIAVINQRVKIFERFPHAHLMPLERQEFLPLGL